jgi:hypothetical protein
MKSIRNSFLVCLAIASVAPAAVTYHFTLEPVLVPYSVLPTEFSVTAPDYLSTGPFTADSVSITLGSWGPGTPNQATKTVQLTQGYVGTSGIFFCFSFASADSTVVPCGVQPAPDRVGLAGGFFGTLPTAPGSFFAAAPLVYQGLTSEVVRIQLDVSEVPEPGTAALMGIAAVAARFSSRKRGR